MRARILTLSASLVAFACGGETDRPRPEPNACRPLLITGKDDPGSGPVNCNALDGLELFLIDDFEVGSAAVGWYTNNDRTAVQEPPPDTDPIPASPIPGGRCVGAARGADAPMRCSDPETPRGECEAAYSLESRWGVHVLSGFLSENGGTLGRDFSKVCEPYDTVPKCPFRPGPPEVGACGVGQGPSAPTLGCRAARDFSDWDGVMIWARKGPGSASGIRLRLGDERTDDKGCVCNPFTNENDTSDGCDKFGTYTTLDQDFRAYLFPFDEMQQGGWGLASPSLDGSNLYSMAIEYMRGTWNLWIDDVALYRRKP
jgi:hypothetical protein